MKSLHALLRAMQGRARDLLHFPERALHTGRREAARSQLEALGPVRTILVACTGNICRSPYFAAALRERLPGVRIASAGLVGFNRPVPEHALSVGAERGIDLSTFRSHLLDPRKARSADLVVVMEARQATHLSNYYGVSRSRLIIAGDLDPITSPTRSIEDPWRQPREVFAASFDRIDRCAETLSRILLADRESVASSARPQPREAARPAAPPRPLPQPIL